MSTVTYKYQPGIHKTRGAIPLAGTSHLYTVTKVLWPEEVEEVLSHLLYGLTLHVCCGKSQLGSVRFDLDADTCPDVLGDAAHLPFRDRSVETVLCDPPYNGKFQWNHDLLGELSRVADRRIVFQHWYMPIDSVGRWKKLHDFYLTQIFVWQPRTYFGRVQVISVLDRFLRHTKCKK
jgi:hypothetical protein